ncbi:MAG: hypothetical protein J6N21_09675 [Butyrivibrio sp.]|nr:hypothetical protein [Butyrivibrio sp.]
MIQEYLVNDATEKEKIISHDFEQKEEIKDDLKLVKSKFLKLNHMHLEYVMGCMKDNTTKVRNIKNYLLSALFNAPTTMGSYYQSEVSHDQAYRAM